MTKVAVESLIGIEKVVYHGTCVTAERDQRGFWVATAWEKGLPVARRPIDEQKLIAMCNASPHTLIQSPTIL